MIDLRDPGADAASVIAALGLLPHPEGGHYRETWRDTPTDGGRGVGTSILFLLRSGESSHWHRVDAAELWVWQAGAPLSLRLSAREKVVLGPNLGQGETPHHLVPAPPGNPPVPWAPGALFAALSRQPSGSRGSKWRRRNGSRRLSEPLGIGRKLHHSYTFGASCRKVLHFLTKVYK